jgi:hypothetical protein
VRTIPLVGLTVLAVGGCAAEKLPNGYTISQSPMNKEWLQDPDGMIVTPGLIERLFLDRNRIIVIAQAAHSGGSAIPPLPIDNSCLIALSINTETRKVDQITLAEANRLTANLTELVSHNRGCH